MTSNGTYTVTDRRSSSSATQSGRVKFPELTPEQLQNGSAVDDRPYSPSPGPLPDLTRLHSGERWPGRREQSLEKSMWSNDRRYTGGTRHGRQKSLSEAIRTVRDRRGSVTQNAAEIADALKAPVSLKLVVRRIPHRTCATRLNIPRLSVVSGMRPPSCPMPRRKQS